MGKVRGAFQGIQNVIRFNWHLYLLALLTVSIALLFYTYVSEGVRPYLALLILVTSLTSLMSLFTSYWVYDVSDLYGMNWLNDIEVGEKITNIHSGFDETSVLLKRKFPESQLAVRDLYKSLDRRELSIQAARKENAVFPGTVDAEADRIPDADNSVDTVFVILSAHEVRNSEERCIFFGELKRMLKNEGKVVVTEHLRDLPNFLAYNIGFLHFYSRQSWLKVFDRAGFKVEKEQKITPFITTFILSTNGDTS